MVQAQVWLGFGTGRIELLGLNPTLGLARAEAAFASGTREAFAH